MCGCSSPVSTPTPTASSPSPSTSILPFVSGSAWWRPLGEVADAAQRARLALDVGRRLDPELVIHDDAEVGLFAVLDGDRDALRRFVDSVLGSLLRRRGTRTTEQWATLEAVLGTGGLGEAAQQLSLHRHTVVYRLQRLRELGIDIEDPARRHLVWLALRARRLLATTD